MSRKFSAAAVAIGVWSIAGTAMAAPQCPETLDPDPNKDYKCVFINTGANKYGAGTTTGNFFELGLTGTLATSIYSLNGAGAIGNGSVITDTNRTTLINAAGFVGNNNYNSLSGGVGTVNINDTPPVLQKNVDALNSLGGPVGNQGLELDFGPGNALSGYRLTFDYLFTGSIVGLTPTYTGGDIAFYYDDLSTAANENAQVLRVNVTASQLDIANLTIFGKISYDFDNNGSNDCATAFCQNFWNFQTSVPQDWYTLDGSGVEISFKNDSNVNPPIPTLDQLAIGSLGGAGPFARQTTLDSSIRFNQIPEPATLALVGLSLLGLAAGSARRNRKG